MMRQNKTYVDFTRKMWISWISSACGSHHEPKKEQQPHTSTQIGLPVFPPKQLPVFQSISTSTPGCIKKKKKHLFLQHLRDKKPTPRLYQCKTCLSLPDPSKPKTQLAPISPELVLLTLQNWRFESGLMASQTQGRKNWEIENDREAIIDLQ